MPRHHNGIGIAPLQKRFPEIHPQPTLLFFRTVALQTLPHQHRASALLKRSAAARSGPHKASMATAWKKTQALSVTLWA